MEIVSSLSTDHFTACLRRFVSRQGMPCGIYSDNGTKFLDAGKELKELLALFRSDAHNVKLADHLSSDGIQWHFNPPGTPQFGGLWEAGVKWIKFHFARMMSHR